MTGLPGDVVTPPNSEVKVQRHVGITVQAIFKCSDTGDRVKQHLLGEMRQQGWQVARDDDVERDYSVIVLKKGDREALYQIVREPDFTVVTLRHTDGN